MWSGWKRSPRRTASASPRTRKPGSRCIKSRGSWHWRRLNLGRTTSGTQRRRTTSHSLQKKTPTTPSRLAKNDIRTNLHFSITIQISTLIFSFTMVTLQQGYTFQGRYREIVSLKIKWALLASLARGAQVQTFCLRGYWSIHWLSHRRYGCVFRDWGGKIDQLGSFWLDRSRRVGKAMAFEVWATSTGVLLCRCRHLDGLLLLWFVSFLWQARPLCPSFLLVLSSC